ncbi:hypothetical protein N1I86_06195 [Bacillus sp. FSL W8-0116]|uniref:hypothetical protein n=1 Tax=Bacillus sp. FSL W8-0116 TaxID=2978206 RepID=UPI0030FD1EE6
MKTDKVKNSNSIAKGILITSILLLLVMALLNAKGVYVQIATPPNGISHKTLSTLLIIAMVISLVYLLKDKVTRGIVIGIGAFFILINRLPELLTGVEYTTFSSPDNEHKFVVIEKGIGQLYQLSDSGLFLTYLADIHTDDGYKPFSNGAYKLIWISDDRLIIHYAFDYMDENNYDNYRKISVQYKRD